MSNSKNMASVADKMKKIQVGDSTRDYLVLLGQLEDAHERFIAITARDFGVEKSESLLSKPDGFVDHLIAVKEEIANAMKEIMLSNITSNANAL